MEQHPTLFDTMPLEALIAPIRLVRATDPDTAHQAAKKASKRGPSQRLKIWEALTALGQATDYELSEYAHVLRSSAAKRRQELCDLGYVEATLLRRATDTGTLAVVWQCVSQRSYSEQ